MMNHDHGNSDDPERAPQQAQSPEPSAKPPSVRDVGRWASFGLQVVISIAIGLFAGNWLDRKFSTDPWFSLGGILLGFTAAMVDLVRLARKYGGKQ